jgi:mycofactocin precursor
MNTPAPTEQNTAATSSVADEALIDDVLVEEVSIDGMCGVY